jgi:hypothetical protein
MFSCGFGIGPRSLGGHAGHADQHPVDLPLPEQLRPSAERVPGQQPGWLCDQQVAMERIAAKA